MRFLPFVLLTFWAAPAIAEDGPVAGRMSCEVNHIRIVATQGGALNDTITGRQDISSGMKLNFDYLIGEDGGLTLVMGTPDRPNALISETFASSHYKGISRFVGSAEFRTAFSEASLSRHVISYKGSDQLYLKSCGEWLWEGQFVLAHVSGLFSQVYSLGCMTQVDAIGPVLRRLTNLRGL